MKIDQNHCSSLGKHNSWILNQHFYHHTFFKTWLSKSSCHDDEICPFIFLIASWIFKRSSVNFEFQDEQGIQLNVGEQQLEQLQQGGIEGADFNDGTVLYIDPNDPQAAALLQQAGLTIADDGTVIGGIEEHQEQVQQDEVEQQQHQQQQQQQQQQIQQQSEVITSDPPAETQMGTIMEGGSENASTEVPQQLFMSSDELESKTGLTLEAAEQKIVAEELGSTLVRKNFFFKRYVHITFSWKWFIFTN